MRCTYCHDALERGESVHCAACLAPHHADCHAAHGRCATPGCADARTLVPDPDGRPAPPPVARDAKARPRGRARAAAFAAALLLLVAGAGLALGRQLRDPAPVATATPAPAPPPRAQSVEAPRPRILRELQVPREQVAIAARDFQLPFQVAEGERLVVRQDARGYTLVVLQPAGTAIFLAEPGDVVEVLAGTERLRAGPGQSVVLEPAGDGRLRIALTSEG